MHYFRFQQHVGTVNAAPLMWPSWLLSLAGTAEAGGLGRRLMENIQAYLFKTSAHLNATRGFGEFTSCSNSERELLLQKAVQLGSRTCSISPLLPHFNPKQSKVIKCQQVVHLSEPSWSTDGWGLLNWNNPDSVTKCLIHSSFL